MVAKTIELPNLRKMFIPDPDYVIIDADLERADAQVVAWDAEDDGLKEIFNSGADIHAENARDIGCSRQEAKAGVHAVNYDVSAATLSGTLGCSTYAAQKFINTWFFKHPKLRIWQQRIKFELETTRTIKNKFGFRRFFFDRLSPQTFHEALAWIPQSTVAIVTNKGLVNIDANLPEIELLIQVHDSLVMQTHLSNYPFILPSIIKEMSIPVPYDDPLIIPVSISASKLNWGEVKPHRQIEDRWEIEVAPKDWRTLDTEGTWNKKDALETG